MNKISCCFYDLNNDVINEIRKYKTVPDKQLKLVNKKLFFLIKNSAKEVFFRSPVSIADINMFFSTCENKRLKKVSMPLKILDTIQNIPKNIFSLNLDYCGVVSKGVFFDSFSHLIYLKEISLRFASVSDNELNVITIFTNLEKISLFSCKRITDQAVEYLIQLTNLREISLAGTYVTDKGIIHLSNLKKLEDLSLIMCKKVTVNGIAALAKSNPNLTIQHNDWNKKKVTANGMAAPAKSNPNLTIHEDLNKK